MELVIEFVTTKDKGPVPNVFGSTVYMYMYLPRKLCSLVHVVVSMYTRNVRNSCMSLDLSIPTPYCGMMLHAHQA